MLGIDLLLPGFWRNVALKTLFTKLVDEERHLRHGCGCIYGVDGV